MEHEEWRDISGYDGRYQVSNLGNVRSVNYRNTGVCKKISMKLNCNGYFEVTLCKNNQSKWFKVHRLVAMTFLPNPNGLPCVNHKDENRTNNNVDNLEWCSYLYNNTYGNARKKMSMKMRNNQYLSKHVNQYTIDGKFIKEWESIAEAGCSLQTKGFNIVSCLKGRRKSCAGFLWAYADTPQKIRETNKPIIPNNPILDLFGEIWMDIEGYEGLYKVSNFGRVKRLANGDLSEILISHFIKCGYYTVILRKNKIQKHKQLHRLIAGAFIPNPDNLPYINHKDENKLNNSIENLEWCTPRYNSTYGSLPAKYKEWSTPVYLYTDNNVLINKYLSIKEAIKKSGYSYTKIRNDIQQRTKRHRKGVFFTTNLL